MKCMWIIKRDDYHLVNSLTRADREVERYRQTRKVADREVERYRQTERQTDRMCI